MKDKLRWCKEELSNLYYNAPNKQVKSIMKNYAKSLYKAIKVLNKFDKENYNTSIDICQNLALGITPFAIYNSIDDWGWVYNDNGIDYYKHNSCDYLYKLVNPQREKEYRCDKRFEFVNIHTCKRMTNFYQHNNEVISKCLNDIFKITFPYSYRKIVILEEHIAFCQGSIQLVKLYVGGECGNDEKAQTINKCFKISCLNDDENTIRTVEITNNEFEMLKQM